MIKLKYEEILRKIEKIFFELGFNEVFVNHYKANKIEKNFVYKDLYCVPICVEKLGFIIEYAESLHNAQLYMYDDGDSFPLEIGEKAILEGIKLELLNVIADLKEAETA